VNTLSSQPHKYGSNTAVVVGGIKSELDEDVGHVLADAATAQKQSLTDLRIGESLGHEF